MTSGEEEMLVHIIDDDESVLRTLARSVKQSGRETMLHRSADAFLAAIDSLPFGCVVSDINMPGRSGLDLIAILQQDHPEWPVVMITGFAEVDAAIRSFRHGAVHFLQKPFRSADLIAALNEAQSIGLRRRADAERQQQARAVGKLTPREAEVLNALARGLQSKAIAWELGISTRTVEMHRSNILVKLGARNTSQAVGLLQMAAAG